MAVEPDSSPQLTVYTDRSGFDALQFEWNDLLAQSRFKSIFLTWEWQTTWWDSLGNGELLILAWRNASADLIGVAPLYRVCQNGVCSLHLVGCKEVADYLDIIIAVDHEAEVYTSFVHYLSQNGSAAWDEISLCNLYESSLSYQLLPEIARQYGFMTAVKQEDVAPYLQLPSTFEAYLETLNKKQRHEIRRKRRKLDREASSWRWFEVRDGEDLEQWVDEFILLHQQASEDKEDFMNDEMAGFFHRIARMAANMGWLSLIFIEIDGELSSTMFNFDYDDRIWLYNSGYNPTMFGQFSPGVVLTSYLIEHAITTGHQVFDFLRGDEVYKYRFGAVDAKVMRAVLKRSES